MDKFSLEDIIITAKAHDMSVTSYDKKAVERCLGRETLKDILKAIDDYENHPTDGDKFARCMFAYGVAYAAGRVSRNKESLKYI